MKRQKDTIKGYPLSCLHMFYATSASAPKHNDMVWCEKCADYRQVAKPPESEWTVHCVNCKRMANRQYGRAFVTAETRAVSHATRYAGHRVKLLKDDELFREFYHEPVRVTLDDPPF